MELLLWATVGVICAPVAIVVAILLLYVVFIFLLGLACIPVAIAGRIANKTREDEVDHNETSK